MPIEHELKYVLSLNDDLQYEAGQLGRSIKIEQGYLTKDNGISVRLRKTLDNGTGVCRYYLQTKCKVAKKFQHRDKPRIIEIGTQISDVDFELLWPAAEGKLSKIRYCVRGDYNEAFERHEVWEVDFFKDKDNRTYFVMAEIEIPEEYDHPTSRMPDFIGNNVVYRVPLGDSSKFSNRKLGNIRYATEMYRSLID